MSGARYFTRDMFDPPTLLRQVEFVDEAFVDGAWLPTQAIWAWMFGHDDFVTEITETEARDFAPSAFE